MGTTVRLVILDSLIAAGVLAYGQAEVWNAASTENLVGPRWVISVSVGAASLLLLVRRQRPASAPSPCSSRSASSSRLRH